MKTVLLTLSLALFSAPLASATGNGKPQTNQKGTAAPKVEEDFDRLDGKGASRVRVDVIEWGENLEIHAYPPGSLVGLALKVDDSNSDRKVLVIGYRFQSMPKKQLIRRAILSGTLAGGTIRAYRDSKISEYDKVVISTQGLSDQLSPMTLDPPPTQLYPEGHPALEAKNTAPSATEKSGKSAEKPSADRGIASVIKPPEQGLNPLLLNPHAPLLFPIRDPNRPAVPTNPRPELHPRIPTGQGPGNLYLNDDGYFYPMRY